MVREHPMDDCLPCHICKAKNLQTSWRCKETAAPPPEPIPPPLETPPAPPGDTEAVQGFQFNSVPPRYVYMHTPLASTQWFNLDAYTKNRKHDKDFVPNLLHGVEVFTGKYTICCMILQLTSIL